MEEEHEIFKSLENPNYTLIRYKNCIYGKNEILIEVSDNNKPKYPIIFRVGKLCDAAELEATIKRLMAIAEAEFPGNTWQLL